MHGVAAATPATAAVAQPGTCRYYAFDINNGTTDPGLIPVKGRTSNPAKGFAQGDELILNDQVTGARTGPRARLPDRRVRLRASAR